MKKLKLKIWNKSVKQGTEFECYLFFLSHLKIRCKVWKHKYLKAPIWNFSKNLRPFKIIYPDQKMNKEQC